MKKIILFVSAILLTALILSSGCSVISSMTDSMKSIKMQSQAPVQPIHYDYNNPRGSTPAPTVATNVTVNATPTPKPRFVYV